MVFIKIENLEVGKRYKSYKELCEVLGIKSTGGDTKRKNIKKIDAHIKYRNEGYSFIIEEIYKTPSLVTDNRGLNPNSHNNQNGAYGKYIRLLILNMLSQSANDGKNIVLKGKSFMLQELNMINDNYRYGNYNKKQFANYLNMDIALIDEFFTTNTRKLKQTVETTLNSLMRNERLIFWRNTKMVSKDREHREATEEEIKFILNCETETLKEIGTDKMDYIYASNRTKEFYLKVNQKLRENNILYSYNAYHIIFADMVYEKNEQLQYRLGVEEETENKSELNSTVYLNLTESADNRHKKVTTESKKFFGEPPTEWLNQNNGYKKIILNKNFPEDNKKLTDICIDETYDSICEKVSKAWEETKEFRENRKSIPIEQMSDDEILLELIDQI